MLSEMIDTPFPTPEGVEKLKDISHPQPDTPALVVPNALSDARTDYNATLAPRIAEHAPSTYGTSRK
jgi:hypothetical protein